MNILSWFLASWPGMGLHEPTDLEGWRNWFGKIAIVLVVILSPIALLFSLPMLIKGQNYPLIVLDCLIWILMVGRLFSNAESYKANGFFILTTLYAMMIFYFVELGPVHARPAWLVMCAVVAALVFGRRGAIFSTILNLVILSALYGLMGPENKAWAAEYSQSNFTWIMFMINASVVTFVAAMPVGFMLDRLGQALTHEREIKQKYLTEKEKLRHTNIELSTECEQHARTEAALRESEEGLQNIVDASFDGIIIHSEGKVIFANDKAARHLGYEPNELTGMNLLDFVSENEKTQVEQNINLSINSPEIEIKARELNLIRKNGEEFISENFSRGIRYRGKNERIIAFRDITERKQVGEEKKRLEAQLVQVQKMEAIGTLAGGIAHDFNNMLSVVLGNTELAMLEKGLNEKVHYNLNAIHDAVERSSNMVRQLLAFARKQTIHPVVLDINDTISGMLKMLRRIIGENIDLAWIPGHETGTTRLDPSQIDQILANLIINARDAINGVGRISIETGRAVLDEAYCSSRTDCVPGSYIVLAVSDDGCGMDHITLEQIFEPFFTTKAMGHGTGLGLATVYGIVKQNKGTINVYSELNTGSTIKIYLPVVEISEKHAKTDKTEEKSPKGDEILMIVEDDGPMLTMAQSILSKLGYTVIAAKTPKNALELARTHKGKIDLLLTDVIMPGMNGHELTKQFETIMPGIKCLYMSGYTADFIATQGVLDEGISFISKPFSISEMALKIRETLDG